jgi:DNA-binding beta-propeller fold protein YncE
MFRRFHGFLKARRWIVSAISALALTSGLSIALAQSSSQASQLQEFDNPAAIVIAHSQVWVANYANNSITELNANTGSLIQEIKGRKYKLDRPSALAIEGSHLWIANSHGNSVTELNTNNGSLVRVVDEKSDEIDQPNDIAIGGGFLWVLDTTSGNITELQPSDDSLVRVIQTSLTFPSGLAFTGDDMWVTSENDLLTEFNMQNGAVVHTRLTNSSAGSSDTIAADGRNIWIITATGVLTQFRNPGLVQLRSIYSEIQSYNGAISISGGDVWVVSSNDKVIEYDATSGAMLRAAKVPPDSLDLTPSCIDVVGSHVWLGYAHSIRELSTSDGSLIRVIEEK